MSMCDIDKDLVMITDTSLRRYDILIVPKLRRNILIHLVYIHGFDNQLVCTFHIKQIEARKNILKTCGIFLISTVSSFSFLLNLNFSNRLEAFQALVLFKTMLMQSYYKHDLCRHCKPKWKPITLIVLLRPSRKSYIGQVKKSTQI